MGWRKDVVMIRREDHITYTIIGAPLLDEMEPLFQKAGFDYEILYGDDIPDDIPRHLVLEGHIMRWGICCVKSYMNSEDVYDLLLKVWRPRRYGEATV